MTAPYHPEYGDIVRLSASDDNGALGCVDSIHDGGNIGVMFRSEPQGQIVFAPSRQFELIARGSDWADLMAALKPFRAAWRRSERQGAPHHYLSFKHWRDFQRAFDAIGGGHD